MQQQPKSLCVKLKQQWMGSPSGTIVKLPVRMANSLFQRDVAEIMEPCEPEQIKEKLTNGKQKLQRRVNHKMVDSSINK